MRPGLPFYLTVFAVYLLSHLPSQRYGADAASEALDPHAFHLLLNTYGRPIRFLRENTTQCTYNSSLRNSTVVRENAISFNFFQTYNQYYVFHMPRCLFAGPLAEQFLNQVDLTETLERYQQRLNTYALVSKDLASYRSFSQQLKAQDSLGQQPTTVPPPIDLSIPHVWMPPQTTPHDWKGSHTTSGLHRPHFNQTCILFDGHDLLFSTVTPCLHQGFYLMDELRYVKITLTEDFFVVTVSIDDDTPMLLIFGHLPRVLFKAPYQRDNFILRQTEKHELLVLVKKTQLNRHSYLKDSDFLDAALDFNYLDLSALLRNSFHRYAVDVLKSGRCQMLDRRTVEMAFAYALALFAAARQEEAGTEISIPRALDRQAALLQIQEFMITCLSQTPPRTTLLLYPTAVDLAKRALWTPDQITDITSLVRLVYILSKQNQQHLIPQWALRQIADFALQLHKTHLASFLSAFARQELYLMGSLVHSMLVHTTERREIFIVETGLCSLAELSHFTQLLAHPHHEYLSDLYTPCSSSGRRDHSLERLTRLFPDATVPATVPAALSILSTMQPSTLETFPDLFCLPLGESFSALTVSEHVSYVVTNQYLIKGISYPVSTTVVGQSLIITQTDSQSKCELTRNMHTTHSITAALNISLENCAFCQSALLEYDDTQGVINIMYMHDSDDVLFALDPYNEVVVSSPRTHYLMLLKNGTVLEVTDVVVDATDSRLLMMSVYALSAIIGIYLLYRMLKTC
ncbi:envelope glycoprotein H [Human betaherpesvirus 5]|nr:envelope glycoprotein H [Human betaherpesvirus 5]